MWMKRAAGPFSGTLPGVDMRSLFRPFLALVALALPASAFAQSVPDVGQMFANFSGASIGLAMFVRFAALVIGIFFMVLTLHRLRQWAQAGDRAQVQPGGIALIFLTSILCISLPATLSITTNTIGLGDEAGALMSTAGGAAGAGYNAAMKGVILFIQFVGHLAFLRGLFIIKGIGDGDRQAKGMSAFIFMAAGACCINIVTFVGIIAGALAPGLPMPLSGF
jgi:hypothetical protein